MEQRICKKCGAKFYFEAEYCLSCQEKIELERIEQLSDGEVKNEYDKIIEDIINSGGISKENEKFITRLMMVKGNAPLNLQVVCAKFDIYDIPEVFIGAESVVVDKLKGKSNLEKKGNMDILTAIEMAEGTEEGISLCDADCYELVADEFEIEEDDFSKIKLCIIDKNGKTNEIEDFLGFACDEDSLPYEMIGEDRPDNGKVITFKAGRKVSEFLPRFKEDSNTLGGYLFNYFDDYSIECEDCDGEMKHFAQLGAEQFGFFEGLLQISKCTKCGKLQIKYFQS